ncbi:hypothetical protein SAY86_022139 [Trapa natans]|uniref:HECT-type E3 ubiquitin transferase n=1 Tax=Trapa natans TaxID=22666 RepID=A0AAN7MLU3_TRANT|nr:hypothetical protein SAY86_022139 [Trapa natans]
MAALRSSLPSRLRQLLSGETAVGPSIRLDSEPPVKVKAFIDKVIQSPLQDIAIPLSGFRWEYDKGNFHHWRPLFLHFEAYLKTYVSSRNDLLLSDNLTDDDSPLPKHAILQILWVMQIILENCHNKSSFNGLEHFRLLLSSTDPEILIASLETLSALVKITKLHGGGKPIACGVLNKYLLSLAQGWGSKEEGLGLHSCVIENEKTQGEGLSLFPFELDNEGSNSQFRLGSTLYFELNGVNGHNEPNAHTQASTSRVIHMPDLHLRKEEDLDIMRQCIGLYNVPPDLRFPLLTRIRYAHAFRSVRTCRLYSRISLLAFIVLVQSNDAHEELTAFFANEPEYTNELIRIVRSEDSVPGGIRTLAMLALGAQLAAYISSHERARILSGSSLSFTATNRTVLLNVLQKAVVSLNNSSDPLSLAFVEALLQFYVLHIVSSSTSGNNLRGWGMLPTFLPLLEDSHLGHMHLVCFAVKTIQKLMDYSSSAVSHFRELGGVELLVQRLQLEVHRVIGLVGEIDVSPVGECSRSNEDLLYSQKRLIKVSLKALGSATYSPSNSSRPQNSQETVLACTLSHIFRNIEKFGGDIYHSAVTLMSEIIHKDPACLSALFEAGLPDAFLTSVMVGGLPSAKALTCVPNGLGAICLNTRGVDAVKETSALRFLVKIFTSKKYVVAMNEAIVPLANAVEELLRHVSTLRSDGVDIVVEIVDKISSFGGTTSVGTSGNVDGSMAMDMDSEDKENASSCSLVGSVDSIADHVSDEQFIPLSIFHVMVLVHRTMENSETCRLFVEKSGIDALLKLLLRPSIAQSSEWMSIDLHSTMVFKGFTQHHSAPLARAFCSALREHLKKALAGLLSGLGSFLLDPKGIQDEEIFSELSLVEFLLFLAASKDNRWVTALLQEFSSGSKDILEVIGRVQRELFWQIALLEDSKLEKEYDVSVSHQSQSSSNGMEEPTFNSFRQLFDPMMLRRTSAVDMQMQFMEFLQLYRSLNSGTSFHSELPSSLRRGSSHEEHHSCSTDGTSRKELEEQRSYYASCCDMVRSLSFHITHLFQELGKVMLAPSRQREDAMNVTPSSKAVASAFASIALDHLNFSSHENSSRSQASVSTKCRYFGKVIDFIDGILMDRQDSCNPILLNCLYGHGVIQSVLTTFEATSQLLFAVNEYPASPMATDSKQDEQEDADKLWIYGSLASYGKLMDHLVTSSFILTPFTKNLLIQPLANADISFPPDAETFVKILQSLVLKSVLPIWSHPQFTDSSYDFITTAISIIKHVFSGVELRNANGNTSSRIPGPPPNEMIISTIVEMGFSRTRAEEALRQVGSNSVEFAMEWLLSHPEEAQEDDELARALAMSLGNSELDSGEDVSNAHGQHLEADLVQLPVVEELLSTCVKLLQIKDSLAFPVHDLLMTICSHNNGQYRLSVISFIIGQLRDYSSASDSRQCTLLSALFHVLALVLHEDVMAREIASTSDLVELVLDLLSRWDSVSGDGDKHEIPKWVTAAFVTLDRLLQADHKLNKEVLDQLKQDGSLSITINEDKKNMLVSALGLSLNHIGVWQQKKLIEISCNCIRNQMPSETIHAILQLCATLTKNHSVAISFLDTGGLNSMLSLPADRLFPGFDNIAATIICHVLEDPNTLQQAMESEIRHSLVVAANRQSSGRVSSRNFLLGLTNVIARDPVIFMQAAQAVCQVEMVGERPYIILLKDQEKDKTKEKEENTLERERVTNESKLSPTIVNTRVSRNGQGRGTDSIFKSAKAHRKVPQSFTAVIELLLDSVIAFEPPISDEISLNTQSISDMDIDVASVKGKGKAIASASESEISDVEASASLAKVVFILKLLTEILLMYGSSVHALLRKDGDSSSCKVTHQKCCSGGIFHHVLRKVVPCAKSSKKERKTDGDWRHKLSTRAIQFLVASCVRSAEARRRIFSEIHYVFNDVVDSCEGYRSPSYELQVYVDLLNDVLSARSPTGSHISAEASATFIDVGLVKSLTDILKVLDLDHGDSPKLATALIKALELVSKEHVHSADSNLGKNDNAVRHADQSLPERTDNISEMPESMGAVSQSNHEAMTGVNSESFNNLQSYGGSEAVTDYMEHDQDLDGASPPGSEDNYMHETSEDSRELQNGIGTVGIQYEIQSHAQSNIDEDDEDDEDDEMSDDDDGDDGEEDDDDDHNDLDEEEEHLAHHDIDQDDNDIDGDDDFDEDVMDEDDDEDEDDDDGVILRLEEGINGFNIFDHIEVLERNHTLPNEALHLMPVEVFGSRRLPRTTSIYNLLGRAGGTASSSRHPLLNGPTSLFSSSRRQQANSSDMLLLADRNSENPSTRLDSIFRSLRSGRHGHRLNLWADQNQQMSSSNATVVPPGLEDVLISQLTRPTAKIPSEQDKDDEPKSNGEFSRMQQSESGVVPEVEGLIDDQGAPVNADPGTTGDSIRVNHSSVAQAQPIDMQLDQNDAVVRDLEAVSQESGGSGATLGESLRSLDVEIGSADGQDDGGERQGSADRVTLGDSHTTRSRRTNISFGIAAAASGRETSLQRVTEVPEDPIREGEQDVPTSEQQINSDAGSGSIDPAFLDALPEELRVEVLSAQQGQVAQTATSEPQSTGDIDPEFLAALPPDIRAEVLAQQQAQRLQQSQELEGQPVEMDTVSIIATFPSDLREEVLLTSSDAILANLTPALVAEANMLRERFAHRYHSQTLLGMYPRNRRGESSRRGVNSGSSLDRTAGSIGSRRHFGMKLFEADGAPLVDGEALKSMIRLFCVVQPLYKGQLQRLLLNLCAHSETRTILVNILMEMLMLDTRTVNDHNVSGPSIRLYGCHNNVIYSRPQALDGVPPLVSRRILETVTYLARNHHCVAKNLLKLGLPNAAPVQSENTDQSRGKDLIVIEGSGDHPHGIYSPIELLLSLLNQPLYLRSVAHLEQLLSLLEVIIDHAESRLSLPKKLEASVPGQSSSQLSMPDGDVNAEYGNATSVVGTLVNVDKHVKNSSKNDEVDVQSVLLNLPHRELRLLCSLLAKEGLSDNAYVLVAEVIKKLVKTAPTHCHLFITELSSAIQNLTKSSMDELQMYGETIKALLSVTTSEGSAILRILQALSSLVNTLKEKEKDQKGVDILQEQYSAALSQVWDINSALEPLWLELSNCINKIESYSDSSPELTSSQSSKSILSGTMTPLPAGTQNVLPYIESFFVVAEKLHPAQTGSGNDFGIAAVPELEDATASTSQQKVPSSSSSVKVDERQVAFVKFSERHRKLLNAFIRQNPGLLEKSFSLLLKVPRFIEFDNKRAHFRSKIKHEHEHHHSPLRISVRRAYILEDSYNQLRMRSTQDLKGRLTVHFQGEEGIDAGGLSREWYQLLSRVIFDKGALLFTTVGNESTFQPNPNSVYQTEHLSYFKFVGRVVGKALFDGQLLDVHFTRSFYKHILGVKVTYHDIEAIDPDYFKNLKWMLENDITDVLDLTFSIDADEEKLILYERTEVTDYELLPGGRNIKVTEDNKHQYVNLVAEHRLTTAIRPQITAFLDGFNELIPGELISIFNDKELELLISGLPEIDLDDMRANTEYSGYSAASPVIQWFWEVAQSFSKEDRARLLQFVTGTSKVPLEGFSALQGISGSQKFQIHKAYGSADHLPSAHTCFNQLDLPEYPSKQHLEERLLLAIHEANEGFGFG